MPIAASSKTYRKVNNRISKALGQKAVHTRFPSDDFVRLLSEIKSNHANAVEKIDQERVASYKHGVRIGMMAAIDKMLEKHFTYRRGWVYVDGTTKFRRTVTLTDGTRKSVQFSFKMEELGFE